jgi:hypothetical protein
MLSLDKFGGVDKKSVKLTSKHLRFKVNLRYMASFANDPDLRISITLSNYLFATVRDNCIILF